MPTDPEHHGPGPDGERPYRPEEPLAEPPSADPSDAEPSADPSDAEPWTVVHPGEPGFPEPAENVVRAARAAPGHWLNVVDEEWEGAPDDPPPPWAVIGRWRTDESGEVVAWERNEEYRPSPRQLGWPEPVSPADRAAQLAAAGYGPQEAVARALAGAEVAVSVDEEGRPAVSEAPDGTPAVAVFPVQPEPQAEPQAESQPESRAKPQVGQLPPHTVMSVAGLLEKLREAEEILFLSYSAPVAMIVEKSALRAAL